MYASRGLVFQDMGTHKLAIADFTTSIAKEPSHVIVHYYLGMSKFKLKQIEEATSDLKQALQTNPHIQGVCLDGLG